MQVVISIGKGLPVETGTWIKHNGVAIGLIIGYSAESELAILFRKYF